MGEFEIIIVGGGLAGPLLANGLLNAGINVQIYERLQKDAKRDGYQIRIAQPAFVGFHACLQDKAIGQIEQRMGRFEGMENTAPIWYDCHFQPLFDFARYHVNYSGSAPMDRVVLRGILTQKPLEHDIVSHGKSFTKYEILQHGREDERVRAWFDDGSFVDGDILIAADGSHSKINKQVGLNNLAPVAYTTFIAKGDLPAWKLRRLPMEAQKNPVIAFADRRTFFCVAYMPDLSPDVPDNKTQGFAFNEDLSSFSFGFMIHNDFVPTDIQTRSVDDQWLFVSECVQHWDKKYQQIIEAVRGEPMHIYVPHVATKPGKNWRSQVSSPRDPEKGHPRVWLLGDAMHAMLPSRGMGGNQAMQDTAVALPIIQRLHQVAQKAGRVTTSEISAACKDFENEMVPRAFEWVERSGGSDACPVDTNKFSGKFVIFLMNIKAFLMEVWGAIFNVLTPGPRKLKHH